MRRGEERLKTQAETREPTPLSSSPSSPDTPPQKVIFHLILPSSGQHSSLFSSQIWCTSSS